MRYPIINPSAEQQRAWQQLTWDEACASCEQLSQLTPFHPVILTLREFATFSYQSVTMLGALNDYDVFEALTAIAAIARNPNRRGSARYWRDTSIRMACLTRYVVDYAVVSGKIAVREIYFNEDVLKPQENAHEERVALYRVSRLNGARHNKAVEKDEAAALQRAWELDAPTEQITTEYAAVNGMNNELGKAVWLMGVHLDNAYRAAKMGAYTLVHNPTQGTAKDLAECLWDKACLGSEPALYLSAVLRQRQTLGQPTHWLVHSQGAIIFHEAVNMHLSMHQTPLNRHRVAIHGSGATLDNMRKSLASAGIHVVHVRNNPFDTVPNINNHLLSGSSLYRALRFSGLVTRNNGGHCAVSPHTLPYLGARIYRKQLILAGETRKAAVVASYIEKRDLERQQRRDQKRSVR